MTLRAPKSLTVRAGLVAGGALFVEALARLLDRFDLVSDATTDVLRYSAQGLLALAVPAVLYGLRRAIGAPVEPK